jgi:hypothetical protein
MIRLFYESIVDPLVKETFKRVSDFINAQDVLKANFKFREYEFMGAVANLTIPHGFGVMPRDAFVTSVTNDETVTFHYSEFDNTNISVTATGACTARYFVGTFVGGSNV